MDRFPMPLRERFLVRLGQDTYVIGHIDFGTNRVELRHQSSNVVERRPLTDLVADVQQQRVEVFDKDGVRIDFTEVSGDILALSDAKRAAHRLRIELVKRLDPLGRVGPSNAKLRAVVQAFNDERKTSTTPATAYAWLQTFRQAKTLRALAFPRSDPKAREVTVQRMHSLTREALDQVLAEEEARLEQMLKDQRGRLKIRGRSGLSLRSLGIVARARVKKLHVDRHVALNKLREQQGLAPLALPPVPPGPSNRTVQLEVYSEQSRWRRLAAVFGQHAARRLLGPHGTSFGLTRICQRWETDVFIADIIISVEYQGVSVPLGVPYLTVIIDCYSGAVVALIIEFTPPNYRSFLAACKQAFSPKAWLFRRFPGIRNPVEVFGIPEVIAYDNAGMFSKKEQVDVAQAVLNVILEPAESRTPNDKPFIESFGAVFGRTLVRYQHANVRSIAEARSMEYDAWQQPQMSIETFVRKVWEWVWNDYHERPMEDRHGWSRRQTWVHSMQSLAQSDDPAALFPLDGRTLDIEVADRHKLEYTGEGFTIDNRHYRSEEMHELAMRFPRKHKFDVREDLGNPQHVFAVVKEHDRVVEVPVASEVPEHLTSNGFRSLQEAKAAMANPDLHVLAEAMLANLDWKPKRGAMHLPSSKDGLAVLLSKFPEVAERARQQRPAETTSNVQEKTSLRDAFSGFFDGQGGEA